MKKKKIGVELYQSKSGKGKGTWRLRVTARNGKVLVVGGEAYVRRVDAVRALVASVTYILNWQLEPQP
jgi:uncharacterized protein YegP (UPF0339 family)